MSVQANSPQAHNSVALQDIGFVPVHSKVLGSPIEHPITQDVIDSLRRLMNDGKAIYVDSQGLLEVR